MFSNLNQVWSVEEHEDGGRDMQLHHTIQSQDRVWSVGVNPTGQLVVNPICL